MLEISSDLIGKFAEISKSNQSESDGGHVETLAFVVGFVENQRRIGTHLVFPDQSATSSIVNDEGMFTRFYLSYFFASKMNSVKYSNLFCLFFDGRAPKA